MKTNSLKTQLMKPTDLTPYENNPRLNDGAVAAVARSIEEFGFRQPIVVDKDHVIVCGHTRLKAAQQLGLTKVPVHVAEDLTDEQIKALRIADNQTASIAEWDYDLLSLEIQDLQSLDFELPVLGFDEDELSSLLEPLLADEDQEIADEIPEPPEQPVSQSGAVYQLGQHRLWVGDATDAHGLAEFLADEQVQLLLTDPPYNVSYTGKTAEALTIENDTMEDAKFRSFLVDAFWAADGVMMPGATFYIWHADSEGFNFRGTCRDVGWPVRQCLIWSKDVMVMGRQDYHWQHEPCLYGWKPGASHQWLADRKQTTVLNFARPKRNADHPTMKPVALFEYQVRNSTRFGQRVLDPFGGSGTTVIACERAGRVARTVELDPRYADVIRRRWANYVYGEGCDWKELTPEQVTEPAEESAT